MSQHVISFSADINPHSTENLIGLMSQLANQGATAITLLLSTPGGSVMHGFNLYNVLKALPVTLTTHNVGNVDSIGNVVFLAGRIRHACPNSTFMFHGVGCDVSGPTRLESKILRERLDAIDSDQRRIWTLIAQYASINAGEIINLFEEARTKDAVWAQTVGLIGDICEPSIPAGVPVHALVFPR